MARSNNIFTTIRTEGALLPADLLQRISEGASIDGLTPESYHRPGEKLNEAINRSWNALQGAWASFKSAQERLPENDLGTSITRERWLLPLFRELDYGRLQTATAVEIDGRSYPISHGWEHVPVHLVSYKLDLDKRTPGAAGAASASPHSLLQVFLNRSDDNLWGFLSNGYKLRILRDNASMTRQAYVEFDLEALMEGEVYSDFVLLWLLCHQSRVEGEKPSDCWLEKWMKVAEDQGTRALDQLRDGVEAAITALGLGFLEYPANHALRDKLTSGDLNAQNYYRQLLRIVYRLLFLFVAEDRDLLLNPDAPQTVREHYSHYYSTQRLRRMAETFKGTRHPDLFEGLRLIMRLLSGENNGAGTGLGLIPLGSFLFSDRAVTDVIDCQISNQHLLTAVRVLSLTYDQRAQVYRTVDYKNLGSDELGSIFESLLELHPQINVPARRFALATAAGNERKTTGSYYTPESLVHALLDSALNPVLEEAIRGKSPHPKSFSQGEKDLTLRGEPSRDKDLLRRGTKDADQFEKIASQAMVKISRELRKRQTPAEEMMWEALRDRRLHNLKFRRQHPIADTQFVADFLCYEAKLIIEIDGGIHHQQKQADQKRQSDIEALGYRVMRFTNDDVINDLQWVLATIAYTANLPSPLGRRAGDEGKTGDAATTTPEQRILALKVCDPACGSGHFLIAAANRMAKALAFVRTGEEEPPPAAIQEAKRDIISHCIYGVDINPMAVELCKVNLWMEALEPGKPLNFLDHRIQVGNSLLGTTPRLMADGIPDDAFSPIEGDDKAFVSTMKKVNKEERKQREAGTRQLGLFDAAPATNYGYLTSAMHALDKTPDDTLAGIQRKEQQYSALANDPEYIKARLLADAWCAAFVWEKRQTDDLPLPMTDLLYRRMEENPLAENLQAVRETVVELKERYQFFHWHVAFPDVFLPSPNLSQKERNLPSPLGRRAGDEGYNDQTGWHGGFDCVLGNPPWERIKIQEKEWFAERAPEIANATNASTRRKAIAALAESDPYLLQAFADDKRKAEGESHFVRVSDRYPLCGRGDVNTYTIFAETSRHVINGYGRVGMIVPSGIATDDTTKFFFQDLMGTHSLASLYDFENAQGIFVGVHRSYKFSLVTMTGADNIAPETEFVFFAHSVADLADDWRPFTLSAQDIATLNPNTGTMATFRSVRDANLTLRIYSASCILLDERQQINQWNIRLNSTMFHMSNDSHYFQESPLADSLELIEAKYIHQFDHRFATDEADQVRDIKSAEKCDPLFSVKPRYWISQKVFHEKTRGYDPTVYIAYRKVTRSTDARTMIATILCKHALGESAWMIIPDRSNEKSSVLIANLNAISFDYAVRQKHGGMNLNFYILKQLPVIPPHTYTPALLDFIVPRVLELTYTAWDLQPFAQDVGYHGAPFIWDEDRRFLMRCELDALYFHLYQISRDDVDYIMDTFPIVKRKDIASYGTYRTKDTILSMYDEMAGLPSLHVPAPKDESATYAVPDVSQWDTWLNPPPADPSVAHEG